MVECEYDSREEAEYNLKEIEECDKRNGEYEPNHYRIAEIETENIMTATKDQERKALEQIRKIVEGLGEDSYIGTAFEGCFEIAEDNIENDFANSMKEQRDN